MSLEQETLGQIGQVAQALAPQKGMLRQYKGVIASVDAAGTAGVYLGGDTTTVASGIPVLGKAYEDLTVGEVVLLLGDEYSKLVIGSANVLGMHAAQITKAATQSIANNTADVVIDFDTTTFDVNGNMADLVNNRLNIPEKGVYYVTACTGFVGVAAVNRRIASIRSTTSGGTGAITRCEDGSANSATIRWVASLATIETFVAGDSVDLTVFQNSGAALNLETLSFGSAKLAATMVRRLP